MRYALALACGVMFFSSPAQAEVWGIKSCGTSPGLCPSVINPSEPPTRLFRFEIDGTGLTSLSILTLASAQIDADGLAIDASGELYAFHLVDSVPPPATASQLVTIDTGTGVATSVGATLSGREIRGATFDSIGRLWAVDTLADELLRIDPATGQVLGAPLALTLGGLVFDTSNALDVAGGANGEILMLDARRIFSLDIATGSLLELHEETTNDPEAGQPPLFVGLAVTPEPGIAFFALDVTIEDDLYEYDASFIGTEIHSDILGGFNSGRGDLASPLAPAVPSFDSLPLTILAASLLGLGLLALARARRSTSRPVSSG